MGSPGLAGAMRATLLLAAVVCFACSTKQMILVPEVDLSSTGMTVALTVEGDGVDQAVIDDLSRYLRGGLIIAGFDLASDPAPADSLALQVHIESFDPGDEATRLLVGFGAGRGSLIYTARYVAPDGTLLGEMNGQEYFTGGEPHFNQRYGPVTTLEGADKVRAVLVQEAVSHIIELGTGRTD